MTRARDIANLVDANGDIVAGALDNVPASNDASALTTGTLPAARIGSGSINNSMLAANAVTAAKIANNEITRDKLTAGMIVNVQTFTNNTKASLPDSTNTTMLSLSGCVKHYSNSKLVVVGLIPLRGAYSHWMGLWCQWGSNANRSYQGIGMNTETGTADGNEPNTIHYNVEIVTSSTGTNALNFGWTVGSGASANRPGNTIHPDRSNDTRINFNGSVASHFTVYEVLT